MKPRRVIAVLGVAALGVSIASTAAADDGERVSKSMSHQAQATIPGYLDEAEHAFIGYMKFYTHAQRSNGDVYAVTDTEDGTADGGLTYYNVDGEAVETRQYAKPMVGVYMYGPAETLDGLGFVGHGRRDAYAAVSLDDGVTWKDTNLSESADESSIDLIRTDIELFKDVKSSTGAGYAYPGDVINMFHSISGNNVLVAWPSRFCDSGQPNYSLDNPDASPEQLARRAAIANYLGIDLATASPDDLYLIDMYGVGGQQGTVDYSEDKFEQNQEVGEVPYACLWTARGELINGDDPRTADATEESFMRWFKAERLTSGRRDVNRVEVQCTDAGCAITWQEDPDGLRAGQGEGPGEGWSGAVAWSGTDVWYSYIDMQNFDVVQDPADDTGATPMTLAAYEAAAAADPEGVTQKPKPFVPMAMPMRLTDNEKCNPENPKPYCDGSAIDNPESDLDPLAYGLKDMCAALIKVPTGQDDEEKDVCVSASGVPNIGNTAATRPRLGLYSYVPANRETESGLQAGAADTKDNFVVVVAEEDKGLGKFGFKVDPLTGVFLDPLVRCTIEKGEGEDEIDDPDEGSGTDQSCQPFDEGKNMTYFSFTMGITDRVGANNSNADDRLLVNLTQRGDQLNQPEVKWTAGEFYAPINTAQLWDFGAYNFDIYNTEIARRGSLLAQDISKARNANAKAGLVALPTWKQGTMNQGGPADVMSRRIVMTTGTWNLNQGNPYAFTNMECTDARGRSLWKWNPNDNVRDGTNPYYPNGLCMASAINLSATIPDTAVEQSSDEAPVVVVDPPQVDFSQGTTFGIGDTNPILFGLTQQDSNTTKVLSWHQCPASFTTVAQTDGTVVYTCDNDARTDATTLKDQSWYNPLEVAKGHRGYLDGDMVMVLYAWSPNYRLNAKGNDRYELYVRRSFDGAATWTTTPSKGKDVEGVRYDGDGTVTCETWRSSDTQQQGDQTEPRVCNSYAAGAAEQARNVTQIQSMKTTTLDPRFAVTGSPYGVSVTSSLFGIAPPAYTSGTGGSEDVRDASRFFIVYETGDNTTTELGEPEPLDLFYSRAVNWGDDYVVWDETAEGGSNGDLGGCYPSDPHEDIDPDTGVPIELIDSGFCNEFDQVDQGTPGLEASEASLQANPGGEFLYAAWAQLEIDEDTGEDVSSDAMSRRIWWIDGWLSATDAWVFGQGPNN